MKLFGSRSYIDAPPAPKMPSGLVELMEGLTKEVLKNNPTEVYKFCAEHMRNLLELRDHNSPKRYLTLEQKILKANSVIRQRAEQRRQKYDLDIQKLQVNKQVMDTNEIKSFDTDCLSIKSEKNPSNNNLQSDDEHFNNPVTISENIENKKGNETLNDQIITSDVHTNDYSDKNERQVKYNNQIIKNIENSSTIKSVQDVADETNFEDTKGIIATVNDDRTKDEFLKEITENQGRDVNEENAQEKVNQQEDDQQDDKNGYVNDNKFADNSDCNKRQSEILIVADADKKSQIEEHQEKGGDDKIPQIEVKEKTTEIEEQPVTDDEGDQNELKVEAAVNIQNYQNDNDEKSVTNEGDQTEMKEVVNIHDKNIEKGTEEQPAHEKGQQNKTKEGEAAFDDKNNQNEIMQYITTEIDNPKEIKEFLINEENDQNEIKRERKENEERIFNNKKSKQAKPVVTQQENYHMDLEKQSVTKDEKHQKEMEGHTNSDYQNDQKEIKVEVDMKSITEEQTRIAIEIQDDDASDKNLEKEIFKITDDNESTVTCIETNSGESLSNVDRKVFETTGDASKDRPKDELNVSKDDFSKVNLEDGNGVTQQSELVLEHYDPHTYNKEHIMFNGELSHLDQLQTQDPDIKLVNVSTIGTEDVVDEIIDKPLIINIDLQQNDKGGLIVNNNKNEAQNIAENSTLESKESGTVEPKNIKSMDLETAAITIQKVFRNFLFRSKTSSFDDSANIEFNIFDHDSDMKDTVYSNQSQILSKDKRPIGISRMDTVLQTVNEEKSLSLSTDDSSTLSSAATVIQAHIRGFLVRNRLNRNKTISSTSLADSDDPPASFETDPDPTRNKTVLNIHIVPECSHFLSRDESMLTSVELSLDGSPPASSNLHPLGYDKSERRKQLKREDAVQSISPPSNNSTRLSEEHDSVKEVLLNDVKNEARETVNDDLHAESTISDDSDSDDVLSKGTVEEKQIDNQDLATTSNKKAEVSTVVSSDELDVVTPFENVEGKNNGDSESNKLVHSGEFHDVVLPTKVSRNDTSVVRGE